MSLPKLTKANVAFLVAIFLLGTWVAEATATTTFIAYVPAVTWMTPSVVLVVWSIVTKSKKYALANLASLFLGGWLLMGMTVPNLIKEIEGERFTLLTYNIKHATVGWDTVRKFIDERKPYLVCLQEADQIDHKDTLVKSFPGYQVVHQDGLVIACRGALTNVRRVPLAPGTRDALEATAENGVRVITVQMASFAIEKQGFTELQGHFASVARIHQTQIDRLVAEYGGKPDTVIAGDFNNPPRGQNYRTLTRHFTDAFAQQGWGFGYTFPSQLPYHRIDYAFCTDIKPLSAEVISTTLSDHRPVFFELLLYRPT